MSKFDNRGRTGSDPRSNRGPFARAFAPGLLAIAWTVAGCGPAQVGGDPQAFRSVDALFTAVSLRDPDLVAAERARLRTLAESGTLPDPAWKTLDSIAEEATTGDWTASQDRLRRFMRGQRR